MRQARGAYAVHVRSRLTGRTWTVEPGVSADLCRDPKAAITLAHEAVGAAAHARLVWVGEQAMLLAANAGMFLNGTRVSRLAVHGPVTVRLGTPQEGEDLDLTPIGAQDRADEPVTEPVLATLEDEVTVNRSSLNLPDSPGGRDRGTGVPGWGTRAASYDDRGVEHARSGPAPALIGPPLTVHVEGRYKTMPAIPGRTYTVGRSAGSDVRVSDPGVSRKHLRLFWDGGTWLVTDVSSHGSFQVGKPVVRLRSGTPVAFDGRLELRLGHSMSGETLTLDVADTPVSRLARWRARRRR